VGVLYRYGCETAGACMLKRRCSGVLHFGRVPRRIYAGLIWLGLGRDVELDTPITISTLTMSSISFMCVSTLRGDLRCQSLLLSIKCRYAVSDADDAIA